MTVSESVDAIVELPTIGLGAASMGNLYSAISDDEAHKTLSSAQTHGFDYFDTAPFYGHGLSEQRIGKYLRTAPHRPLISTKVGRILRPAGSSVIPDNGFASPAPFIPRFDYSAAGVRASFEGSQDRLGLASVDILLLHDIGELTHGAAHNAILNQALEESLPEMAALKSEGKTNWIGLGVNEIEVCREVIDKIDLDVLLIAGRYTLMEHELSLAFLNDCHARGVKIIIGGVFNSGLLVAAESGPLRYDYAKAPQWALDRLAALRKLCSAFETPLPAVALQFCSAHPAVASVIPGAQTAEQVQQIAKWIEMDLPVELWAQLKEQSLISRDAPVPS